MSEREALRSFLPDLIVDGGCDGSSACRAEVHIHGCFADNGRNCDHPSEHCAACAGDPEALDLHTPRCGKETFS